LIGHIFEEDGGKYYIKNKMNKIGFLKKMKGPFKKTEARW
jgi:hypothetical protein